MSLSVAIIEPDTQTASAVENTMTGLGLAAHVMADGDVLEFVRKHNPSLIVLSVELLHGSGYSFCNRLKRQADLKQIPVILTSSRESEEAFSQHQRQATPADGYLRKPFGDDELRAHVVRLLPDTAAQAAAPLAARASTTPPTAADNDAVAKSAEGNGPPPRPKGPPPRKDKAQKNERGPTFDELLAQGRTEAPAAPPPSAAGPEAKLSFLRDTLRQREADLVRARELWSTREREFAQIGEVLELRERDLERAKKAREDLLAQIEATEDQVAALRMDLELAGERSERLEREKKALGDELENATGDLERTVASLEARVAQLSTALASEQQQRAEENDRSATEIRDLVDDLDRTRADAAKNEADANEQDAKHRSEIGDLQARIAGLDVDLSTMRNKLVDAQKDADALRRELKQLRADKSNDDDRARKLLEELEGKIHDLALEKDGVEGELAQTSALLSDSKNAHERANDKITDLEALVADFEGQLSDKGNQLDMSETRVAELQADLADAKRTVQDLAQEKGRVEQRAQELSLALQATTQRLERAERDLDDAKGKYQSHARELDARIADLREKNAEHEARLRDAAELQGHVEAHAKDVELRLEEKHRELDAERVNRQRDMLKRDQRIGDLEAKLRDLDTQLHENERIARQKEADLTHHLDLARARGDELDRDLNRAKAKSTELEALLTDAKDKNTEFVREQKRAEVQMARLNEEIVAQKERSGHLSLVLDEHKGRVALLEAEVNEERQNRQQEVQTRDAALDRTQAQANEKLQRANEAIHKMKADLAALDADARSTREKLQAAEERGFKLQALLETHEQEKHKLFDKNAMLDGELESATAKAEQLNDELLRTRAALKRTQEEVVQAKRERLHAEERFQVSEATLVKKLDDLKVSAAETQRSVLGDVDKIAKERDDARAKEADIRKKAEQLMRKYRELEAVQSTRATSESDRLERLSQELRQEKEARAREAAQAKADIERLRSSVDTAANQATQTAEADLAALRVQLRDKEDRLNRAATQYNELREKAKAAIERVKELDAKLKSSPSGDNAESQAQLAELRAKYNEVVTKLKTQAELNKRIDAAHRELAEKHRAALLQLQEYRDQGTGEATVVTQKAKL